MRDTLQTREYFDIFILEETKRVEKYEKRIASGTLKEDRILPVKDMLIQLKLGIIIAKYSRGDSILNIKNEFISLIDLLIDVWNRDSYEDNIRIASLTFLLGINDCRKEKIKSKLKETPYYDCLIDYILNGTNSVFNKNVLSFPESYKKLLQVIEEKRINVLMEYLREWYKNHDDSPWFDSHKSTKVNTYYGYWSFEAAAISKRLNLEDDSLKNELYYPYDMVHFIK